MQDHPQIEAFNEAASMLRTERYWDHWATDERVEFLRALGDVLTEVCYHLDANEVLPLELLRMVEGLLGPATRGLPVHPSAGLLLMTCLDRRIEQLIAAPDDSRNTGEEWSSST